MFFCLQINLVFAQWINLNSGTDNLLLNLFVFNEDTLFAVGDSGIVLKTTDGGIIWNQYSTNSNERIISVDFLNDTLGVLIGNNGFMAKTINGGISWTTLQNINANSKFKAVKYVSTLCIVAVGDFDGGHLMKTFDSGQSWNLDSLNTWCWVANAVDFINPSTWIVPTDYGEIFKTSDAGLNWQLVNPRSGNSNIQNLQIVNDSLIYVIGHTPNCDYCFFTSIDSGATWNSSWHTGAFLFFFDNNTGYVTHGFGILKTEDNFASYIIQKSYAFDTAIFAIQFANQNVGYVVGQYGTILKTTNGGGTSVNELNTSNSYFQINPNPVTSQININSRFNYETEFVLYDITSINLLNKKFVGNAHVNVENFLKGIYFYQIKTNKQVLQSGKIAKQ